VTVLYNSEFNNDQSGLISFTDNGKQFLYTDFEPYGANRVFPCFDQPDLKAYMNLTVVGPDQWRILSH
jgi:aminopeptidase N